MIVCRKRGSSGQEKIQYIKYLYCQHNPEPRSEVWCEICGGVLVENASDDFPQQKKLENILPNFAGSSPSISPKTSPTSLWKSLVLSFVVCNVAKTRDLKLDIFETPVTVTPQQEISKTLNSSSSKIDWKLLNVYFGEITFTFGEITFTFGEIRFTLGDFCRWF